MNLHTPICDLFGIEHPIILAGMGGVSTAALVAAVSEAGGLGVLGGATMDADRLRKEIREVKERTSKPFAVDLLAPNPETIRPQMKVLFEEGVKIFVAGLAVPEIFIDDMHAEGMLVAVMCGKVRHAVKSAAAGADVVVAQGTEAGGHTGEVGGMALIPQVVDAVDVPVLAAGGIADGRGVLAALALGAQGAVIGTRFIATEEASAAASYRRALVENDSAGTIRTRCYTGKPCRTVRNTFAESWLGREPEIQPFPIQAANSIRAGVFDYTGETGDVDPDQNFMPAGQGMGMIHDIEPATKVFERILAEAEALAARPPWGN